MKSSQFLRTSCLVGFLLGVCPVTSFAQPLTTLDYTISGQVMQVTPAALSVPKGIPGSIGVTIPGEVPSGAFVEATLRGPSFPARCLVGEVNKPLVLPPLNLVGDYSLDGIRLVSASGETLFDGAPSSVPVRVFDEVLVSRVTSRPLTLGEIEEKGIVIDDANFRAVEFEVGFVVDGATIPIKFPVVTPSFKQSTEIIPAAELEARLAQAEQINAALSEAVALPPGLEVVLPQVQIKGINVQFVDGGDDGDLALKIPPIPALMVIPGNIGFLNQFFSVQIFTENAAPDGSGLSVHSLTAELVLPTGPDRVAGSFESPGDDPLRFARVAGSIRNLVPVRATGPDGKSGTDDDIDRLQPGDTGQGELLVEGLQEGLHVMDLKLSAKLDGLAAGTVSVTGKAAGSILVRNPKFSMAFTHPRTVRSGEPYEAAVTILNTSSTVANLVSVELNANNVSGGLLESDARVELGNIAPGQTATATFRIRSQKTGAISFSNLTTSDDSVIGRFRLKAGVDERGVTLSPDTLVLPEFVDHLPPDLVKAAQRMLGQALGSATAGQLPPGVIKVSRTFMRQKALELAEAGQRVRYGEPVSRVLPDLLLDWQGARDASDGWDQLLRVTDAGQEWREALMLAMRNAVPGPDHAVTQLVSRSRDMAGRGEAWNIAASDRSDISISFKTPEGKTADAARSDVSKSAGYHGSSGEWLTVAEAAGGFTWKTSAANGATQLSVMKINANGTGRELLWRVDNLPAGGIASFDLAGPNSDLQIDDNGDGIVDRTLASSPTDFTELPPQLLVVRQDAELHVGRPTKPCFTPETTNDLGKTVGIGNYANVVAVLFSKPMTQATANVPSAYTLDNGNAAAFVQMQPSGRIALLTMNAPLGGIVPREMTVAGTVKDVRGNAFVSTARPVESFLLEGVNVKGRVIRADGSFAANVPVTLTYTDKQANLDSCDPWVRRVAQVRTDASGAFAFDFVIGGLSYTISTTDTSGLSDAAVSLILNSAVKGEVDAAKLNELASLPQNQDTLLAVFAAGALPQAIAKAEGLDRAAIEDLVLSDRFASESFYALRFRGRGTVIGQVVLADGQTPVAGAAANLFPDINSRELGRGILTDSGGRFAFYGVPLGPFSLEATAPNGLTRTVSGVLQKGAESADLVVALGATPPVYSDWQGRLTEPDGTSVAGGAVYVAAIDVNGNMSVVGRTVSNESGYWSIQKIPVGTYTALGFSLDGKRGGRRGPLTGVAGAVATANIVLQARATVKGVVQFANGDPVSGALVGGGQALVTTDSLGRFTLDGVPTGNSSISAGFTGDETSSDPRKHMPRIASTSLNVQAGDNYAVIRFEALGRIVGQVIDAAGAPVPRVNVAMPFPNGDNPYFLWVKSDENGRYEFPGLRLTGPEGGPHDLSAPAPPVQEAFDGEGAAGNLTTASSEQVAAIIGEAFSAFTGVNDPFLNGEGANFNPKQWGFVKAVTLDFDGETEVADIRFVRSSNISGVVKNGQGVPIGARVRLTGIGPTPVGSPTFVLRAEKNSDPALGTFEFSGDAFVGDWGLQAASPFFPVVLSTAGRTTSLEPNVSGIVLQFPRVQEVNGSLTGLVLYPDGTPAGANVEVSIGVGSDDPRILRTDAQGRFTTGASLFSLRGNTGYSVSAFDPLTGGKARDSVYVKAAQDNQITLTLLGRGNADVLVLKADGTPVTGAAVEISGGQYPQDRASGVTNSNGRIVFSNLFQGPYAVGANATIGLTRLAGRAGTSIPLNGTGTATITLAATATVRGTYVESDGVTPVAFANVRLGSFAYAPTDANGRFSFVDVPLGSHVLTAVDPVTGRGGNTPVTLSQVNEVRDVTIIQTPLGTVSGLVLNAEGNGTVPNAEVVLTVDDAFALTRTFKVTSGPDGAYSIAGVPVGSFTLTARQSGENGTVRGNLLKGATTLTVNVAFAAKGSVLVQVFETNGSTPATNATVNISGRDIGRTLDTNAQGQAAFAGLPMGDYTITAISRTPGQTRNRTAAAFVKLSDRGAVVPATLTMRGIGSVQGTVFQGDGTTPAGGAEVKLEMRAASADPATPVSGTVVVGPDGSFSFDNLPAGLPVVLSAKMLGLAASETVQSLAAGQSTTRNLMLTASGTIIGRALRADGSTVAAGTEITITFPSRSGLEGVIAQIVDASGRFSISPVPQGTWSLKAVDNAHGGIAFRSGNIAANAETDDVQDIILDEVFPSVIATTPSSTSDGVDINTNLQVTFSEPLKASSVNNTGVFVRLASGGAAIPATMTQPTPDTVLIDPSAPLESSTTYQIVAVDGNLVNAVGTITNRGPRDLVDRPLNSLFSATFTTRDQRPPVLLSFTPENNAEQVDTRAVVRLSFDEPLAPGAVITLSGPGGAVPGTTTLGVNNLVLVFTPTNDLPPNATFTANISGLTDAAGNAVPGQPLSTTFKTLDTLGPTITTLRVKNNQPPLANSTITLETVLAVAEPGVSVRLSADFQPIGVTAAGALELPFTLPASGTMMIRAIASDRFGNEGLLAEFPLAVIPNQAPTITFTRLNSALQTVSSGGVLAMRVEATDDGTVTELRAAMAGAAAVPLQTTTGAAITLQGIVPASAIPGAKVDVLALAKDNSGASSGEQKFQVAVTDGTAPALTIVSPAANTRLTPGVPFEVAVDWADNSGAATLQVALSGPVLSSQSRPSTATSNATKRETFTFDVSAAPQIGDTFTVTVRATDAAGLFTERTRTLRLPDARPPQLATIAPADNAVRQSLWTAPWMLTFDEAMDSTQFTSANLVVTRNGTPIPATITPGNPATSVTIAPALPLQPGSEYVLNAAAALRDEAGNPWLDVGGGSIPAPGRIFRFTAAAITSVTPPAAAPIVPGQRIASAVNFEQGLGATSFRFNFNGGTDTTSGVTGSATTAAANLTLPTTATEARLRIVAAKSGAPDFNLSEIALTVRPRAADDDFDGLTNGVEADAGLEPFRDDAAEDPDLDGRINVLEIAAGTNPFDADSDDDGLNDGVEFTAGTNPLLADSDSDGLSDSAELNTFQTNPLLADTDTDGLSDGLEIGFGRYSVVSGSFTWAEAKANAISRNGHLATITSQAEADAITTVLGSAVNQNLWIGLQDQFVEGAFRWVTGETFSFQRFGAGEPNNAIGGEDFVYRRGDGFWNDGGGSGNERFGYLLETGFATDPLLPDTDGDGTADNLDTLPGPANQAPVALADTMNARRDTARSVLISTLLTNDTDADSDPLAIASFTQPANGTVILSGTNLIYTPTNGYAGSDSFTYLTTDPSGATSGAATVNITVTPNRAPIAGVPAFAGGYALSFDGVDDLVTLPDNLINATTTLTTELWFKAGPQSANGGVLFTYQGTAYPGIPGNYVPLLYIGADGKLRGGYFIGSTNQIVSTATVTNNQWHHAALVAQGSSQRLYLDGVLLGVLSGGIQNFGGQFNQIGTGRTAGWPSGGGGGYAYFQGQMDDVRVWHRALSAAEVTNGAAGLEPGDRTSLAGEWRLNQANGAIALDGSPNHRDGTLNGGVTRVASTAPIEGFGQLATVAEDSQIQIIPIGSDPDGDPITFRVASLPLNGQLFQAVGAQPVPGAQITAVPAAINDPARGLIYVPNANFSGADSFAFVTNDRDLDSVTAAVLVTVTPSPDAPTPQNDGPFTTPQPFAVTTGNVLANDSDPDGEPFTLLDFTQPTNGSVVNNGNGTFTYTPQPAFSGTDTFTYRITDGTLASAPAMVTINVTPTPVFTWNKATGGDWNVASNWTPAHVPVAGEIAKIDLPGTYTVTLTNSPAVVAVILGGATGTQTLNINNQTLTTTHGILGSGGGRLLMNSGTVSAGASSTVPVFDFGGGTLTGAGSMSVTGTFNWSGGTLSPGGELIVGSGAVANLTGLGNKVINRTLRNRGTVNYTGTALFFNFGTSNGRIENEAGATFIVDGDGDFNVSDTGTNSFNNAGTLIKRNAANTFFHTLVPLNNTGLVTIEAGTLELRSGGTFGGTIHSVGGVLTMNGGTYNLNAGGLLNQASLNPTNATINVNHAIAVNFTRFSGSGGTVNFGVNYSLANLTLSNTSLGGSGNVNVAGTFNWSGGTLASGGELIVGNGAVANLTTANIKYLNRTLRNRGTVNYTGTRLDFNAGFSSARIENEAGATFIVDGDGDFSVQDTGTNAFNNAGTLIKRNAANTFFHSLVPLNNTGLVTLEAGTMELRSGGTFGGTINSVGGVLTMNGGTYNLNAGGLLNQASLSVSSATLNINSAAAVNFNSLTATSSTVNYAVNYSLANLTLTGTNLGGVGNVTVTGTFNWGGGILSSGGELIVGSGAVANLTSGNIKYLNRTLRNRGTVNYTGTALYFNAGFSSARIENEAGATFVVDGDGDFNVQDTGTNAFNNAGTLIKRNAATTFFSSFVPLNNTGLVSIEAGTLQFQGSFTQTSAAANMNLNGGNLAATSLTFAAGSVTGVGTITANVTNSGATFAPAGDGNRTLAITGTYNQQAGGKLELDLDSNAAGAAFDRLTVSGGATLNGSVSLLTSLPLTDEVFPLVTYASRTGTFGTITVNNGGSATVSYLANRADFTVTSGVTPALAPQLAASYAEWIGSVSQTWELPNSPQSAPIAEGTPTLNAALPPSWDQDPNADPDQDGSSNLLEYAFQTNPLDPSSMAGMEVHPDVANPGEIEVRARASKYATDLEYVLERSLDMVNWTPMRAGDAGILSVSLNSDGPGANLYQVRIGFQQGTRPPGLFRVRVQLRP